MEIISSEILKRASKYILATLVSPWWTFKYNTSPLNTEIHNGCPDLLFKTKFTPFYDEDYEGDISAEVTRLHDVTEDGPVLMCGLHACCIMDLIENHEGKAHDNPSKSLLNEFSKKGYNYLFEEFIDYGNQERHVPRKVTASALKLLAGDHPFWSVDGSSVITLNSQDFDTFLKSKKHALVIFYSPTCGHCQKAKPEFLEASRAFKGDKNIVFAAVDCTQEPELCRSNRVVGYPTMIYFNYSRRRREYDGQRKARDIINFMNKPVLYNHNCKPAVTILLNSGNPPLEESSTDCLSVDSIIDEEMCHTV